MNAAERDAFKRAGFLPKRLLHAGTGGVETWLLAEAASGRPAVAKLPRTPAAIELVAHEAEILEAVRAAGVPGVPVPLAVVAVEDALCPITGLLAGIGLDQILARARGPLPTVAALGWAIDLCRLLDALHRAGVVHRDAQPRHVVVRTKPADGEGSVALIDFTAACRVGVAADLDRARTGELPFAAPDQFELNPSGEDGGSAADPRLDVYAAAATLFRMLAGRGPARPFRHEPLASLRPDLPPLLHASVDRALQPRPGDRTASAAGLALELEAAWEALSAAPSAGSRSASRPSSPTAAAAPAQPPPTAPPPSRAFTPERIEITAEERAALTGSAAVPAPREAECSRGERDALRRVLQRAHERALASGPHPQALLEFIEASRPKPGARQGASMAIEETAATAAIERAPGPAPAAPVRAELGSRRLRRAIADSLRRGSPAERAGNAPAESPTRAGKAADRARPAFHTRRQRRRWRALRLGLAVLLGLALGVAAYGLWRRPAVSPPPGGRAGGPSPASEGRVAAQGGDQ